MTIIAAYKQDDKIVMGCDSCASDESHFVLLKHPKIFYDLSGKFLIGCAGYVNQINILRQGLRLPPPPPPRQSNENWFVKDVLPRLRKLTKDCQKEKDGLICCIIAWPGNIALIDGEDFIEMSNDWCCVGSGESVAAGSFLSLEGIEMAPEERVRRAVTAACHYSLTCALPVHLLSIHS